MTFTTDPRPTLQHVLDALAGASLPPRQAREWASAVRTFCAALNLEPADVPAEVKAIRDKFRTLSPITMGVSQGRFANIRSYVGKAVGLVTTVRPSRDSTPLTPDWAALLEATPLKLRRRFSAGVRFLSTRGIAPLEVSSEDLLAYRDAILNERMRANPEQAWDHFLWNWNQAVETVPGWPQVTLTRETRRETYVLPPETFSASFRADLQRYQRRLANEDLDEDGPARPATPATIKTRTHQLRVAASILVHKGVEVAAITSLASLVELDRYKLILRFLMERAGGKTSPQVAYMASALRCVAEYHVKVDEAALRAIRATAKRVAVPSGGLTAKNRDRLRHFDDPELVRRFLALPQTIRKSVERDKHSPLVKAKLAQMAAAIALLQAVPMRRKNLAALDTKRHIVQRRDRLYLVIPEAETKNRQAIDLRLPDVTHDVLVWYVREYRPLLLREPTSALFPGEGPGAKAATTIGYQITQTMKRYLGADVNPHMFRHIAGKLFLDSNPGQYEVVRQVLRHKSINTTTSFYTGAEAQRASDLYVAELDRLRTMYGAQGADR